MNSENASKNIFMHITYSTPSKASMRKTVITAITQNNAFPN